MCCLRQVQVLNLVADMEAHRPQCLVDSQRRLFSPGIARGNPRSQPLLLLRTTLQISQLHLETRESLERQRGQWPPTTSSGEIATP